ncbi:MAG: orotate phosphoribosyltransferase [Actinomycetia bacterium]|nr:orotate phosphoribosyltransferase [Actinomycetes bacterium]MCP4226428.1 orotate phosphoribosyltransferase [Actinomycetes bacterium]MCP5034095.1 orotate phosphoribosyltransferase [Actinomycetes bacterium]
MNHDALAAQISAVAQLSGDFLLRSGLRATTYFDKYQFESDPELLQSVAEQLAPLLPADTDILAGLELGGVPIATALSLHTGLPAVFVRKKAKEYGTAKLAEGPSIDGKRLTIIEDVITTGGQVVLSTKDLRDRGAIVDTTLCVIDREQGGTEGMAEIGIELRSLFSRTELEAAAPARANS